jgi:hypothetical protein
MEDYRAKVEKLSPEKLQDLAERYRKTITRLELDLREARAAAIMTVVDYKEQELNKKRQELAEVEKLLGKTEEE